MKLVLKHALNKLIAEVAYLTLMLANELRLKTTVMVSRCINFYVTIIGDDGYAVDAVTACLS